MSLQVAISCGQSPGKNNPDNLKDYKWQKRVLLVFSPNKNNPAGIEQLKLLNQAKQGLADRNLVLISVAEKYVESKTFGNVTADNLRQQFKVKPEAFTLILIGKDGGEKYRSNQLTKPIIIFNIIDAMPMRQSEMKEKDN